MDSKNISVESRKSISIVRISRSHKLNSLTLDMMDELRSVAESFRDDMETIAVILTGEPTMFSAGIDLRDDRLLSAFGEGLGKRRQELMIGPRMCRAWEEMEQITICAIEGHCVGGALALALACDFRIMGVGARLKIPELKLGLNLSWQSIPRLVNLVGPAMAKKLVLLGEDMSADQALKFGFAQELADDRKALDAALNMAEKIAQMPPLPVKMTKQSVNAIANALNHVSSYMDTDQSILCQMTQDHKEGMEAFLNRRPPSVKGS